MCINLNSAHNFFALRYKYLNIQSVLTQENLLSPKWTINFLQDGNVLATIMKSQKWLSMKISRCHITNIDQWSSKRLQKALEDKNEGQEKTLDTTILLKQHKLTTTIISQTYHLIWFIWKKLSELKNLPIMIEN